jgi:hypothetical protein
MVVMTFRTGFGNACDLTCRGSRQGGTAGSGQPSVSERGVLDLAYWVAVAGFAAGLRGLVATRYAESTASFLAICQIRALVLWTKLF